MPSKTPAPPIEIIPGETFLTLPKFKISPPIKVPQTPEIKAQEAAYSGVKAKASKTEKIGGIKGEMTIPLPGTTLDKNLQTKINKKTDNKTGSKSNPFRQIRKKR